MVTTRSQSVRSNPENMNRMNRDNDSDSDSSASEVLSRNQMNEFDNGALINYQNGNDRHTVDLRFSEMNKTG